MVGLRADQGEALEAYARRQARLDQVAWRADVAAAIDVLADDGGRPYRDVAAEVGISTRVLYRFLDGLEVASQTEEKLRTWAAARPLRPVAAERVAIHVLSGGFPPAERADLLHDLIEFLARAALSRGRRWPRWLEYRPEPAGEARPAACMGSGG